MDKTGTLPWDSDDSANLRNFLGTQTGKRLVPKLLEPAPELLSGGDVNAILIRSGEVKAWTGVVAVLDFLAHPVTIEQEAANAYPALDDDNAWDDGNKIK